MKKYFLIVCLLLIPTAAMAYVSPGTPQGYVSDFAHVLNAAQVQSIDSKLSAFETATGDEIAVVTVPAIGNDETIETYAVALFADWGIGKKAHDNGLLILVAPNDRAVRIEVGYGLEGNVTDLISNNIIQKVMLPAFKTGDYASGISGAVDAVTGVISQSPDATQYRDAGSGNAAGNGSQINFFALFFIGVVILNILARILGKTKSWWLGGVIGAVVGAVVGLIWGFVNTGIIAIVVLTILGLIFDYIVSKHPPGSGPGRGGGIWPIFLGGGGFGGSGSGGAGGGFGGFGGGMSGGGGASGRW